MFGRFPKQPKGFLFWTALFFAYTSLISSQPAVAAENSGSGLKIIGGQSPTHPWERKVISPGGYSHLASKARDQNKIRVIVQVAVPLIPESFLSDQENPKQRAAISEVQGRVLADLARKGRSPLDTHAFKYTPHLSMTVDAETIDDLLESTDVENIQEDIPVPPTLNLSIPRIGATTMHSSGLNGTGVAVAILDTGVDKNHPFLTNSVVSEACYSSNSPSSGSSSLCPGGVAESTAAGSAMPYGGNCPAGECSHGTHVAGIAAGNSGVSGSPGPGVAPGAGIIAIQVFSRFDSENYCGVGWSPCVLAWTSDIMKGLQRVYDLRGFFTIASANLSLGGGGYSTTCDSEPEKPIIDNLRAAGIATIISSGNNSYCGYISAPACISSAISVGATDDADQVASYSNSAHFMSLLAPGSFINSSVPGGGYSSWNGTSMAAPHVTGAWALMKQSNPSATVSQILNAFSSTGLTVTDSTCTSVSKKRINVSQAEASLNGPPIVTTGSGTNLTTNSVTLNGTVNANNLSTTVTFQYGLTTSYGTTVTADQSPVTGSTNTSVSKGLTGLTPSTIYHYRVVGTSSAGTTYGSDIAFTTLGPPWTAALISPSGTLSLTSPTYYWYAVSNATEYHLYIDDSTGNRVDQWYTAAEVGCASGTGICSFTPSIILAQGAGSWRIQTRNSYGDGSWSSSLNFAIVAYVGKADFNSDGKTDLLWRNQATGEVDVWYMNGATISGGAVIVSAGIVPLNWEIMGTGDFNSNGKSDLLWRNKMNGEVDVWYMNGATISGGAVIVPAGIVPLNWEVVGTGDFNNDGKTDLLWRNKTTGEVDIWYMNGATISGGAVIVPAGIVPLNWEVVGTGDFNNDGKTDLLWRNKTTGEVDIWYMNGATISGGAVIVPAGAVPLNWEIMGTGDFNNDGRPDLLWRNKTTGEVDAWYMNGATISGGAVISPGVPLSWELYSR